MAGISKAEREARAALDKEVEIYEDASEKELKAENLSLKLQIAELEEKLRLANIRITNLMDEEELRVSREIWKPASRGTVGFGTRK